MMMEYQAVIVTSATFMTAQAASPLLVELAKKTANISISWGMWALAGIVPGLLCLIITPYLLYKVYPPEIKETPQAAEMARTELQKMGPMKRSEKILLVVFFLILALWVTSEWNKLDATVVALIGVGIMILTGVINWEDVLAEKGAWDALIWFGGLVMMAGGLNQLGFMKWIADSVAGSVAGLAWLPALLVLTLVYFYAHYGFASVTAKVTAMFPPFLAIALVAKAPPQLTVLLFGICSALGAGLTHYGTGPSPIYYNAGYMDLGTWWKLGLLVSIVNIVIWFGVGFPWWKVIGLW
jgi:DASS family divalent anion:Na+ symporter